jgi:acid phosphatase
VAAGAALALPLIPYDFTVYIPASGKTGDIVHRFYHEQLQIDNGLLEDKNGDLDKFVTWSDNPGLVLLINNTDPSQPGYMPNIRNRLDDAGVNWRWYSGGWTDALANNVTANTELFQFHHQPFAYYTNAPFETAPTADYSTPPTLNPATTGPNAHLQDEQNFFADIASSQLPAVTFIKPLGLNNEHPGYTDVVTGQKHVAALVAAVRKSEIWKDCVIIITNDENGGRWDHIVPPVRKDAWGVGVRVPCIIISPFARKGSIDHTEYQTVSILKLIERRFNLAPLSARDSDPAVNDLTNALHFGRDSEHQHNDD